MLAFVFTDFVFNSFCCLSASVFSCAFGSVFTYVMFLFLFPVVSSVLFSLLHCALISLFCVTLFLSANLPTCVISIYFDFSYLYVLWYGWLYDLCGCSFRSRCVCVCLLRICIYLRLELA